MDLEMVLNELSLAPPAPTVQQARQRMIDFLDTARIAIKLGAKNVIRTSDDLSYLSLAPNYPLVRWRNDDEVDRDTRRFFKTLLTKSPYLKDIEDNEIKDRNERSQFSYQNEEAKGLGIAYLLEALALSFKSAQRWDRSILELTLIELDEEGEMRDEQILKVTHACSIVHSQQHENWIKERVRNHAQLDILDGNDIWVRREALFPNLRFCETVQKQLQGVLRGDLLLQPIMKKLFDLNTFCENWHGGFFDCHKIPGYITPESDATLKKYAEEHTFMCPDGTNRLFSWHARLTPSAWRIYFYINEEKKSLIVGYIGHKLPNVLYRT
jgi:hypothetical protein